MAWAMTAISATLRLKNNMCITHRKNKYSYNIAIGNSISLINSANITVDGQDYIIINE